MLKGDLNLCTKGSGAFALDFTLPTFAFSFGLAFSPDFGLFSLLCEEPQAVRFFWQRDVPTVGLGRAPARVSGAGGGRELPGTTLEPWPGEAMPCAPLPRPPALCLSFLSY